MVGRGFTIVLLGIFLLTPFGASWGGEAIKVNRFIKGDRELYLFWSDEPLTFELHYDRVMGTLSLKINREFLSPSLVAELKAAAPSSIVKEVLVSSPTELLFSLTPEMVNIRTHPLVLPSLFIMELQPAQREEGPVPYELKEEEYKELARSALQQGEEEKAIRYLEFLQKRSPHSWEILHLLGVAHHLAGNYQKALEYFSQTATHPAWRQDALAHRVAIFASLHDTASAFREWEEMVGRGSQDRSPDTLTALSKRSGIPTLLSGIALPLPASRLLSFLFLAFSIIGMAVLVVGGMRKSSTSLSLNEEDKPEYSSNLTFSDISHPQRDNKGVLNVSPSLSLGKPSVSESYGVKFVSRPELKRESSSALSSPPSSRERSYRSKALEVISLHRRGVSRSEIARTLGMSYDEVSLIINLTNLLPSSTHA